MKLPSLKWAFLIHFGISLLIFLVLAFLMMKVWYPGDLFTMDGGWQGLKIIAPIDLVLGPALTLCFYRTWKKNIKFDMAAIAAVQIAALSYGVYAAYQQRPAAIVFAENRFETLSLSEFKTASADLKENNIEPKSLKEFGNRLPVIIHAEAFTGNDWGQYLADVMNGMPELRERSDRYQPIQQAQSEIAKFRIDAQQNGTTIEMTASSPGKATIKDDSHENQAEIYPIKARYQGGTIEFDANTFEWIKITKTPASE